MLSLGDRGRNQIDQIPRRLSGGVVNDKHDTHNEHHRQDLRFIIWCQLRPRYEMKRRQFALVSKHRIENYGTVLTLWWSTISIEGVPDAARTMSDTTKCVLQ